jgi:hypothetical protein
LSNGLAYLNRLLLVFLVSNDLSVSFVVLFLSVGLTSGGSIFVGLVFSIATGFFLQKTQ